MRPGASAGAPGGVLGELGRAGDGPVDRSRQTVAELLRYWLETYARHHVRPGTLEGYGYTINGHIIPALGAVPVQRLTAQQLQQFYSDKIRAGCSPRTVQLCHLRLKQALRMAVEQGLVARNVAEAVRPPRVERREMRTWTAAQAQQFLTVAAQSEALRVLPRVMLA